MSLSRPWDEWWDETDRHPGVAALGPVERGKFDTDGLQHIDAFRGWVLAFQRLTRLNQQFQDGKANESEMVKLGSVITDLMTPFSPLLATTGGDGETWSPTQEMSPSLENVLGLQIFNHIAEGDIYHLCEFDNTLFVHQRGRAERGQYRSTGVKFCSTQCAQSQASFDYRRRKKAENAEEA